MSKKKSGFSLIELAIVMSVIGLVIGGVYVAYAAVNENRTALKFQEQANVITARVMSVFSNQASAYTPSYAVSKILGLFPGDMPENGHAFVNAYGGDTAIVSASATDTTISFSALPQSGCVKSLKALYGAEGGNNGLFVQSLVSDSQELKSSGGFQKLSIPQITSFCDSQSNNIKVTVGIKCCDTASSAATSTAVASAAAPTPLSGSPVLIPRIITTPGVGTVPVSTAD